MEGMELSREGITKTYVREHFPVCTQAADQVRAVFGDGVKMVYAKENGEELGKMQDQDRPCVRLSETRIKGPLEDDEDSCHAR
jgi:hypothetical protein